MSRPNTRTSGSTSNNASDRISREDATLRGSWIQDPFGASAPVDTDWSDEERDTSSVGDADADFSRGARVGYISESPERPGLRFHTPVWVKDLDLFGKFGRALSKARKKEYPTLADFQRSKTDVECLILWKYFVDHQSFQEIYDSHREPQDADEAYGIYDISTKDASSVCEAIEFAARKNGTFSTFDEIDGSYRFLDNVKRRFRKVTARKINHQLYRVDFRQQVELDDKYFLPEKLDPSKRESTIAMRRYISDLVDDGYALLKIAKPTEADRKAARQVREAEEQQAIARAQLGAGTNPSRYEHTATLPDQAYKPSQAQAIHREYGRLAAWENGLEPREKEQERGEQAYQNLLAATKVADAVAKFTSPWQPPAVEPECAVNPCPAPAKAPAVRHEVLRMSIQLLLAGMVQRRPIPQFQGTRL